jgi:hypothetical protein
MYWQTRGINILPELDYLLFIITGCEACLSLARIVEEEMRLASLTFNWEKSDEPRYKNELIWILL